MIDDKRLIEFCQELIRVQSYSGNESGAAQLVKQHMEEFGFDEVTIDRYGSVLGRIRGKQPGKTILMDGHIDTVKAFDSDSWEHDPFKAEICDGKIYGRGSSDMKGSDTAMIVAAARFAEESNRDFAGEICVACSVHEECFEGVASEEMYNACKPDFVIIGEATSGTVKIGQRGRAEVVVETKGVSCHSSNPAKGKNAVYHMMSLIEEIKDIVPNEHCVLGKGVMELTDIMSFPYPGDSIVPELCRATYDCRTLVGEDEHTVIGQIEAAIVKVKQRIPDLEARAYIADGEEQCWTGETIKAKRFFPAWCYDENMPEIQAAVKGLKEVGIDASISHFAFCTNGSCYCGKHNVPGIGFGPSEEWLAHVKDEYIEIESLKKACHGFQGILKELTKQ